MNLYELSQDILDALEAGFDPETGEALAVFDEAREIWTGKAQNIAAYILNREAEAEMIRAAMKKMEARAKVAEKRAEYLRGYLLENMRRIDATKIEADDKSFQVIRYPDRDESVEIEDGAIFPPELCNDPKPPLPSRSKIKSAILAGHPVAGAHIVRKDRLAIK